MRPCPTLSRRDWIRHALLPAMLLISGSAWAGSAWAGSTPDASSLQQDPHANVRGAASGDGRNNVEPAPLPWSSLDPSQRSMLEPLKSQWDQLPPHRQQHLAEHAGHWAQLPPDHIERIKQHLAKWAQMTPEQRRTAWSREDTFRSMPEGDRQRVLDAYQRFKALSPDERRALMRRFHEERAARHHDHDSQATPDHPPPKEPPQH